MRVCLWALRFDIGRGLYYCGMSSLWQRSFLRACLEQTVL